MRSKLPLLLFLGALALVAAGCGGSDAATPTTVDTGAPAAAGATVIGGEKPCDGYGSTRIGNYTVLVAFEGHAPILDAAAAATSTDAETHILVAGTGVVNDESASRHVEVHICDTASGGPAQHLTPTVTLRDNTDGTDAAPLAVAEVYGKGDDPANVHYGNNVAFPSGHQAEVGVTIAGQSGTFKIAVE